MLLVPLYTTPGYLSIHCLPFLVVHSLFRTVQPPGSSRVKYCITSYSCFNFYPYFNLLLFSDWLLVYYLVYCPLFVISLIWTRDMCHVSFRVSIFSGFFVCVCLFLFSLFRLMIPVSLWAFTALYSGFCIAIAVDVLCVTLHVWKSGLFLLCFILDWIPRLHTCWHTAFEWGYGSCPPVFFFFLSVSLVLLFVLMFFWTVIDLFFN